MAVGKPILRSMFVSGTVTLDRDLIDLLIPDFRTLTFKNSMIQGGLVALEGMINYTFGVVIKSFGKIGKLCEKGLESFYIKPFELIFDYLRDEFR